MTGVPTPPLPHTCHVTNHLVQVYLIKLTVFGDDHRSCSSSLCSLLQWSVTSSIVVPYIFLSTLLSNTLRLWSSLNVRDQVSYPHKTTGKIIIKYILILLKEVMKWRPPGRRKRGRPKLTWAEGIRGLMGEKRLMEED